MKIFLSSESRFIFVNANTLNRENRFLNNLKTIYASFLEPYFSGT